MKTLSELIDFVHGCEAFGIKVPDNMFVCSPEIIQEAEPWGMFKDKGITRDATSIKIYGVRVVRDFAEVVPN